MAILMKYQWLLFHKIHNCLITYAILQRIILLSIKFVFLLILKQFVLTWINKKSVKSGNFPRGALSLSGLGIMHILCLLVFPRQTKAMLQRG